MDKSKPEGVLRRIKTYICVNHPAYEFGLNSEITYLEA